MYALTRDRPMPDRSSPVRPMSDHPTSDRTLAERPTAGRSVFGRAASRALLSLALLLGLAFAAGCEGEEDECDDSECTTPPPPTCDGSTLITYGETGTCIGDDCRYQAFTTECEGACEETLGPDDVVIDVACAEAEGSGG